MTRLSRFDPRTLRAALWALRAERCVRKQLDDGGIEHLDVPRSPRVPAGAVRGVAAVLRRRGETCLVRAAIWQEWHAAHGLRRDLVIGVTSPGPEFSAHAWLDGEAVTESAGFMEISRLEARR
jgi:hypothetical protein